MGGWREVSSGKQEWAIKIFIIQFMVSVNSSLTDEAELNFVQSKTQETEAQ